MATKLKLSFALLLFILLLTSSELLTESKPSQSFVVHEIGIIGLVAFTGVTLVSGSEPSFRNWIPQTPSVRSVETISCSVFAAIFNVGWAATQVTSSRYTIEARKKHYKFINLREYMMAILLFLVYKQEVYVYAWNNNDY
ncbi:hypothetical protein ACFE04_001750 [Oxalis oulophora]